MIVTCERCTTQFRLDAARISEPGVLVRCSRCRHAFVVKPPPSADEDPVEAAAERAVTSAGPPELAGPPATADVPERDAADDSGFDWEFDNSDRAAAEIEAERVRAGGLDETASVARAVPAAADLVLESESAETLLDLDSEASDEPADPPVPDRFVEPLAADTAGPTGDGDLDASADGDELGSPVDWDIFTTPAPVPPPAAATVAPLPAADADPAALRVRRELPAPRRGDEPVAAAPEWTAVWLPRAGTVAGWLATAGLCVFGLVRGLAPPVAVPAAAAAPAPGLALDEVRGRWIDNVHLGEIYVVSGRLRNEAGRVLPMPALELVLRDATREAVGAPIPVGVPRSIERLREGTSAELSRVIPSLIGGSLRAGESRGFEVVAWPLPHPAQRFEIRAQPTR